MVYETGKMQLEEVGTILENEVNSVSVCRDIGSGTGTFYSLIRIKDHDVAVKLLRIFEKFYINMDEALEDHFDYRGNLMLVLPYRKERPLSEFYMGGVYSLEECESVCISVILACIAERIPLPILYLSLKQGQISLGKDGSVYLGYSLDLTELDPSITERDCAVQCARIIKKLLEPHSSKKAVSLQLISKKSEKNSYSKFTELYKDIRIAASPKKKKGIKALIHAWFIRNKDTLFKVLLWVSLLLLLIMLLTFFSQIFLGDVPFVKVFLNGFKYIGTEALDKKM